MPEQKQYVYGSKFLGSKANDAAVNNLYQKYFGRDATQAELDNWGSKGGPDTTVRALEDFLRSEQIKYGVTDEKGEEDVTDELTDEQKISLEELNREIDAMEGLSVEQRAVLKEIASQDFTGARVPDVKELQTIIDTAAQNVETDLSPYYEKITGREIEDLQRNIASIRGETEEYAKQEAVDYKSKLQATKQDLRSRGLTFSGASRRLLGKEGALEAKGVTGELEEARQREYEEKERGFAERTAEFGVGAERELGTEAVRKIDFGTFKTPYGEKELYKPTTERKEIGEIPLEKKRELEREKWSRVSQYKPYTN